jgi:hypothetical protein
MKAFISYSTRDKDFVQRLAADLRNQSEIDLWFDQWEINPGDRIPEKIEKGLSEAALFLLVLSPDSVDSRWVDYERQAWLTLQIDEEKIAQQESRQPSRRLIPILYRNCHKPAFLQPIHHVKIDDQDYEKGFNLLLNTISGASEQPIPDQQPGFPNIPFPGPPLRKYILTLLKSIIPSMFEEVVFLYGMPHAYLPTTIPQVEKSIQLINYAISHEGEPLSKLLECIFSVAPNFRNADI